MYVSLLCVVSFKPLPLLLLRFLQCVLSYITRLSRHIAAVEGEVKFWQSLRKKSYTVIDKASQMQGVMSVVDLDGTYLSWLTK